MRPALPRLLALGLGLAACSRTPDSGPTPAGLARVPADATMNSIPLGAPPGEPASVAALIANPYEGDAGAVQDGKRLFGQMNCVYCHGAQASGLMGPSLEGPGWRYGGTPSEIYNSIHDGRPKGMPAWGGRLPADQIWRLVAYIESLGGAEPPAKTSMASLGGASPSTTGPQAAGQQKTDTARQALDASQRRQRR